MSEPLRINKYLQRYYHISRRDADRLIDDKKVLLDGELVRKGEIVQPSQKVFVDNVPILPQERAFIYLIMKKPAGYICSRSGHRTVFELLPEKYRKIGNLSYIGRLDVNTTGVLLFTDDGEFAHKILRSNVSRIYRATLDNPLSKDEIALLKSDFQIDGRDAKIGKIFVRKEIVEIEIFEGKWHEVRRIFAAIGHRVIKLRRISFAGLSADDIAIGKSRLLNEKEIKMIIDFAGLDR